MVALSSQTPISYTVHYYYMLFQLLSSCWYCVQLICAALIFMDHLLNILEMSESDTDTEDTVTSPPEMFPAQVQQRVHAQQVQLGRRRMHAGSDGH